MPDQESAKRASGVVPSHILLADAIGQAWVLSVRPDGQLQTAKWPDGEPLTPVQRVSQSILAAAAAIDPSELNGRERMARSFDIQLAHAFSDEPE